MFQVCLEKIDISAKGNEKWLNVYQYDIPVFHLNDKFLMKHKGDITLLNEALDKLAKQ